MMAAAAKPIDKICPRKEAKLILFFRRIISRIAIWSCNSRYALLLQSTKVKSRAHEQDCQMALNLVRSEVDY